MVNQEVLTIIQASAIVDVHKKVNDENKKKLSAMVHQSLDHLLAAAKFAFRREDEFR